MVTREEVVWAYRLFLGREPESETAIELHCRHADTASLRRTFLECEEFAGPGKIRLLTGRFRGYWVAAPVLANRYLMWIDLGDDYVSAGCLLDNWEKEGTDFMKSVLKPGDVVVDVGANLGWFTLNACAIVGKEGRIHAFEPRSQTADYLARTVALNALDDRVTVHRCALSDSAGHGVLAWSFETTNPGGSFLADGNALPGLEYQNTALLALDDLELARLDFLKVDVEGAETRVLKGARRTIERCRPPILLEVWQDSAPAIFQLFDALGYRCFIVDRTRYGEEVTKFPADWDLPMINLALLPDGRALKPVDHATAVAAMATPLPPPLAGRDQFAARRTEKGIGTMVRAMWDRIARVRSARRIEPTADA